jgi:hypothetical protein
MLRERDRGVPAAHLRAVGRRHFFRPSKARDLTPFRVTGRTSRRCGRASGYDLRPRLPELAGIPILIIPWGGSDPDRDPGANGSRAARRTIHPVRAAAACRMSRAFDTFRTVVGDFL